MAGPQPSAKCRATNSAKQSATLFCCGWSKRLRQSDAHQIVPKFMDEGTYLASESTFTGRSGLQGRRSGEVAAARPSPPLTTHRATAANQVWCWDITWLPTTVKGRYFYWYMMKDIFSRKLVVNEVHAEETADHAADCCIGDACVSRRRQAAGAAFGQRGGDEGHDHASRHGRTRRGARSAGHVSNDNAYAEALFRTAKYCPRCGLEAALRDHRGT